MNNLEAKVALSPGCSGTPHGAGRKRRSLRLRGRVSRLLGRSRPVFLGCTLLLAFTLIDAETSVTGTSLQGLLSAENDVARGKMVANQKPSGDVDTDFAAMMLAHHQSAIEIAQAEQRYGRNEQLRRIAREIIVENEREIVAMHLALDQPLPDSSASPNQTPGARPQRPGDSVS
jgi:Domain of unknown function (DUF305)